MTEIYGADIGQLRALSKQLDTVGEQLSSMVRDVSVDITSTRAWKGPGADRFRSDWAGQHRPAVTGAGNGLHEAALALKRNADAQELTSTTYDGAAGGGATPYGPTSGADQTPGDIFDVLETGAGLMALGDAWKAIKYGLNLNNYLKALDGVGDLAAISTKMLSDARGIVGNLGAFGKWSGVLGGAWSIYSGIDQMINPNYSGWRSDVDRVMGGVSVIGGAATIGMFMGVAACTGPVGIGIVVGAGLVVGAWELGNLIYDNWDAVSGFVSDPGPYLSDGLDTVKDVAGDVGNAISDAAGDVSDFVGGIFG